MRVIAIQLTANAKPLLNNTFINTELKQHQDFEMQLKDNLLEVTHREKGHYSIPLASISWFRPDPTPVEAAPVVVKKRRSRTRKAAPVVPKAGPMPTDPELTR